MKFPKPPHPRREAHGYTLPEPEPAAVKFLLYGDNSGGYYWTIVCEDGQVLARSPRFGSYEEANIAADIVYRGVAGASFEDRRNASSAGSSSTPEGRRR